MDDPVCCGSDNLEIIATNFRSLDAVFNEDCPVCAVNLKVMWCLYGCSPIQSTFVNFLGYTSNVGHANLTITQFWLNENYACDIFLSCKQESFIAESGVSSALAFLDFLGTNGQDQSLSIINFQLEPDSNLTALNNDTITCDTTPPDEIFMGYAKTIACDCSYCQLACATPAVDDHINFFDGLSWKKVGISYGFYIGFTIVFQICVNFVCKKKPIEYEEGDDNNGRQSQGGRLNNQTGTTE